MTITAEQRERRRRYLGASDTPAILGLSPWATPADVYWSKVGPLKYDAPTEAMQTGNRLEASIVSFAAERLGVAVERDVSLVHADGVQYLVDVIRAGNIDDLDDLRNAVNENAWSG